MLFDCASWGSSGRKMIPDESWGSSSRKMIAKMIADASWGSSNRKVIRVTKDSTVEVGLHGTGMNSPRLVHKFRWRMQDMYAR